MKVVKKIEKVGTEIAKIEILVARFRVAIAAPVARQCDAGRPGHAIGTRVQHRALRKYANKAMQKDDSGQQQLHFCFACGTRCQYFTNFTTFFTPPSQTQTTTNGKRREPSKATSRRVVAAVTVLTLVLSFVCEARQIGFLHRGGAGNS